MSKVFLVILLFIITLGGFVSLTGRKDTTKDIPLVATPLPVPAEQTVTMPEPFAYVVKNLEPKATQIVYLNGPIFNSEPVVSQLHEAARKNSVVYLLINSPGGSVFDGSLIVTAVESSPVPVHTVCMQLCASMAAIIHQYGAKRLMVNRSTLMFHDAAGNLQGYLSHMTSRINYLRKFISKADAFIAIRARKDINKFFESLNSEVWLDAEDSLASGFSDEIVNMTLPTPEPLPVTITDEKRRDVLVPSGPKLDFWLIYQPETMEINLNGR